MARAPKRPPIAEAMRYAQIGMMLIAPMLVIGAIGYFLDRRWATAPWLLLSGLILGMATGFINFFRLVLTPPDGDDDRNGRGR